MRAVVTRVHHASVTIDGEVRGQIGQGFLVLLGVGPRDTEETADKLAEKICNLRVFEDENDKMNLNLEQVGGSLLVISQFTLYPAFLGPPGRSWPSRSMSGSWTAAASGASPWNTGSSAPRWRWTP